jgi:ATP-binding cassette, subfamily B, bacterial
VRIHSLDAFSKENRPFSLNNSVNSVTKTEDPLALADRFASLFRIFQLILSATGFWSLFWIILLILQGVLPLAIVYLTKTTVDGVVLASGSGLSGKSLQPVIYSGLMLAGAILLVELLNSIVEWIRTAQSELVNDCISHMIFQKSSVVDLAFFESPAYYDKLHQARTEAAGRSLALLESGGGILQNSITLLAMGAVLIPYGLWLPVVLLVSTIPAFAAVLYFDRKYHGWWKETTADRRWTEYYDVMLTHPMMAAEIRMFGLSHFFLNRRKELRLRLREEKLKLTRNQMLARMGSTSLALMAAGAAMGWMVWRIWQGMASLGDLALFYQAFSRGQALMRSFLSNLGRMVANSLFVQNLFSFLDMPYNVNEPVSPIPLPIPIQKGIDFHQVTFRYPGSTKLTLEGFNLHIPAGKFTAIVGPNGAGKSTLAKLICRFFDPDKGEVKMDDIGLVNLSSDDLRRHITVLMQHPVQYHDSAARNIAYGNFSDAASCSHSEIEHVAQAAGAHDMILKLPQKYDTLLGKWFVNGTELSAGEWQRIALARAFYRKAQIIILDEPTSYMDSWSEADWFDRFRKLAIGRTGIIITHRFTIARHADIIHVMDQGKIVESGSHDELVALNGMYARSWVQQTQAMNEPCALARAGY